MATGTLANTAIKDRYKSILKLTGTANDELAADDSAKYIEDGNGNESALSLSTNRVGIGTDAPITDLDVSPSSGVGTIRSQGDGGGQIILQDRTATSGKQAYGWRSDDDILSLWLFSDGLGSATTDLMVVDSTGNVGIGTAAPYSPLHIKGAGEGQIADGSSNIPQLLIEGTAHTVGDSGPILCLWNSGDSANNDYIGKISFVAGDDTGATTALTTGTEYASIVARISDETDGTTDGLLYFYTDVNDVAVNTMVLKEGNVGIGTTAPNSDFEVKINTDNSGTVSEGAWGGIVSYNANTAVDSHAQLHIRAATFDAHIKAVYLGSTHLGAMTFVIDDASETAAVERMRIDGETGNVGIGIVAPGDNLTVRGSEVRIIKSIDTAADGTGTYFFEGSADDNTDINFQVTTSGIVHGTGSFAADLDYAEFFESVDGRAIVRGTTVVLIDGKVQAAKEGESPFGVVRPNGTSSVVGGEPLKWYKKHLRDDYGVILREEDGRKKLNPDFVENLDEDGEQIYARRADRDEWQIVGLLGQVQIEKGQPVASSWIKMKEVSDSVDMYYVFPCPQIVN